MSQETAKNIPATERCSICHGEGTVSYIQARGGLSEPGPCYNCDGSGREPAPQGYTQYTGFRP